MKKFLVIDASPLIYAVYSSQGHLKTSDGTPTGLIFGFLRSVNSYRKRVKNTSGDGVVICYDSPGPVKKAEGSSTYKSNRVWTQEKQKMYDQIPSLREVISLTCWSQLSAPGYEADDLVASVVRAKASRGHQVDIVSADNDLMQVVGSNSRIFRPAKRGVKDHFITSSEVKEKFGVRPAHLLFYRSLVGDSSDNLKGVGLPELDLEMIRTWLNTFNKPVRDIREIFDNYWQEIPDLIRKSLLPFKEEIESNFRIMQLYTPPVDCLEIMKGKADEYALSTKFAELEFKSLIGKEGQFCE